MQSDVSPESVSIMDRLSRAQGRKARRHSATAKLTRDEHQQLEKAAKSEGKALSEWSRDALLATARGEVVTPIFTEVIAIRQLLNATMRKVACGREMTDEEFSQELQGIRSTKHKAAAEMMQQYALAEKAQ